MDANEQRLPPLPHYDDTSCGGEGMFTAQTMREYAIAALAQQVPADGEWVLVPRDPTPEMIEAGIMFGNSPNKACIIYQSMLAATPQAPQPVVDAKAANLAENAIRSIHSYAKCWIDNSFPDDANRPDARYALAEIARRAASHEQAIQNASQPQQGAVEAATRMGYASVMDALDDLSDYRKDTIGQQAVDGWRVEKCSVDSRTIIVSGNGKKVAIDFGDMLWPFFAALAAHGKGG